MPLTQLDENCALIVIDMQKGVAAMPLAEPFAEIAARNAELAQTFRRRRWPVVLVNAVGRAPGRTDARMQFTLPPDWAELIPELHAEPTDMLVSKQRIGAFLGTDLHEALQARGVTQVVITGVATSMGVESTARSAHDLGYNVVLASDAMTDRDPETHRYCVEKVFPRFAEVESTAAILEKVNSAA